MGFDRAAEERAALDEADGLAFFCDASIVGLANTLLGTLAGFATLYPDWARAARATVGADAGALAVTLVGEARARFRLDEPIGAVPHGARLFGDVVADQAAWRRAQALCLLAVTGRVVEAAGGGERCLVILSAEHLDAGRLGLPDVAVRFDR